MSDPRLTPANDRVMADHLPRDRSGRVRVAPQQMQVAVPVADLLRRPGGPRDRQLLFGARVGLLETEDGACFVQAEADGYVGYLPDAALAFPAVSVTHTVSAPATHAYARADLKSPDLCSLSFGSKLTVIGERHGFAETSLGFIPAQHVRPADSLFADPVEVAALFLGTPYLWGGNSRWGIDCSGLIQAACHACGIACPGDSDQQAAGLGETVPKGTLPKRGDLLFWKGHVAWVSSPTQILHANAHTMSTNYDDLSVAVARIEAAGDGPVTAHKRL